MRQTIVNVTPALAREWLGANVSNNRTIRRTDVEHYKELIKQDRFLTTPEGVQFNVNGHLIDGQHRLTAIAESNKTVPLVVWTDVPEEVMEFLNRGRVRTLADVLTVTDGLGTNIPARYLVSRAMAVYEIHHPDDVMRKRDVPQYEWVKQRYLDNLVWACKVYPGSGSTGGTLGRKIRSAPVMGALVIAHAKYAEEVETFTRRLVSGLELTETDPAYALRKYLDGADLGGLGRMEFSYATLKAVHSAILKRRLSIIKGHYLKTSSPEFKQVLEFFGVRVG